MIATEKELETQERQARETAASAREKIAELEDERRRLAPAVVEGEKEAAERTAEIEKEIAELERWAKMSEIAADELRARAEEARREAAEQEHQRRRREYDRIVLERRELLERVEEDMAELKSRLGALLAHEEQRRAAWRALGHPDPSSRPYADVLQERIAFALSDFLPGVPQSRSPVAMQPLPETDDVTPLAEIEETRAASTSRAREYSAERERVRAAWELQQKIELRRAELLAQQGIDSDSSPLRRKEAEEIADEWLKKEFPELRDEEDGS